MSQNSETARAKPPVGRWTTCSFRSLPQNLDPRGVTVRRMCAPRPPYETVPAQANCLDTVCGQADALLSERGDRRLCTAHEDPQAQGEAEGEYTIFVTYPLQSKPEVLSVGGMVTGMWKYTTFRSTDGPDAAGTHVLTT